MLRTRFFSRSVHGFRSSTKMILPSHTRFRIAFYTVSFLIAARFRKIYVKRSVLRFFVWNCECVCKHSTFTQMNSLHIQTDAKKHASCLPQPEMQARVHTIFVSQYRYLLISWRQRRCQWRRTIELPATRKGNCSAFAITTGQLCGSESNSLARDREDPRHVFCCGPKRRRNNAHKQTGLPHKYIIPKHNDSLIV